MSTRVITPLLLPLAALLLLVGGCQKIYTRSFDVEVRNDSAMPITVWLTKDGPLYEKEWKSPEDLAIETRSAGEMIAGAVVAPGKSASRQVTGKFGEHSNAILRIYLGEHTFSDLLAMSRNAPDRRDYILDDGANSFHVIDRDGMMMIERGRAPMSMRAEGR